MSRPLAQGGLPRRKARANALNFNFDADLLDAGRTRQHLAADQIFDVEAWSCTETPDEKQEAASGVAMESSICRSMDDARQGGTPARRHGSRGYCWQPPREAADKVLQVDKRE